MKRQLTFSSTACLLLCFYFALNNSYADEHFLCKSIENQEVQFSIIFHSGAQDKKDHIEVKNVSSLDNEELMVLVSPEKFQLVSSSIAKINPPNYTYKLYNEETDSSISLCFNHGCEWMEWPPSYKASVTQNGEKESFECENSKTSEASEVPCTVPGTVPETGQASEEVGI